MAQYLYNDSDKTTYPLYNFYDKLPTHTEWKRIRTSEPVTLNLIYPSINFITCPLGFADQNYVNFNFTSSYDSVYEAWCEENHRSPDSPSFYIQIGFQDTVKVTSFSNTSNYSYKFTFSKSDMMGDFLIMAVPHFMGY